MFIDTHCHLDFPEFDLDRGNVINRSKEGGIGFIINVGSTLQSSRASVELSEKYDFIYSCVGIHPHDADSFELSMLADLELLAQSKKVVAIGEIGLDYFKNYSKADNQKKMFLALIALSKKSGLPLVIHSRQAEDDILKILKDQGVSRAIVHCFSGNADFLKSCLDLGFMVSFTCNITYKKAQNLRDIIKVAPLERICLETDAPYLSPEGLRGRRNEPLNVKFVAEEIARIKNISLGQVALATTDNAMRFFNIPGRNNNER